MNNTYRRYLKTPYRMSVCFGLLILLLSTTSCKENYPVYDQYEDYVYFDSSDGGFKVYSFIFKGSQVKKDTIWFTVKLAGALSDHDRTFKIAQEIPEPDKDKADNDDDKKPEEKEIEAVSGVHYLPFDDPFYEKHLIMPAHEREGRFPVVILRDPSLKEVKSVRLAIKIVEGGELLPGYIDLRNSALRISDRLVRPTQWTGLLNYMLGKYGPVKHQFMIDHTHFTWDDDYIIKNYFNNYYKADQQYLFSLKVRLQDALDKENERRKADGEGPLMEADGTEVRFGR